MSNQTKNSLGFTIIEVMIVMALAGAILLIVFLTVPALRRNFRNTSRRHDAAFIASQRFQYDIENSTSLSLPPGGFDCSAPITSKPFCQYVVNSLSHYSQNNVTFHSNGITVPTTIPTVTNPDNILTDSYYVCDPAGTTAQISTSPVNMIVLFAIETASGAVQQCIQSGITATGP